MRRLATVSCRSGGNFFSYFSGFEASLIVEDSAMSKGCPCFLQR